MKKASQPSVCFPVDGPDSPKPPELRFLPAAVCPNPLKARHYARRLRPSGLANFHSRTEENNQGSRRVPASSCQTIAVLMAAKPQVFPAPY